jgi:hypothetical protein
MDYTLFPVKFEVGLPISVLRKGVTLYKNLEFKTVEFKKKIFVETPTAHENSSTMHGCGVW